jgi:hypothetical protein
VRGRSCRVSRVVRLRVSMCTQVAQGRGPLAGLRRLRFLQVHAQQRHTAEAAFAWSSPTRSTSASSCRPASPRGTDPSVAECLSGRVGRCIGELSYTGGQGCREGLADHSGGNLARILGMTSSPVGRDRSDDPFAEIGDLALLLRHLETGAALSLIEHHLGRQDLGLERLNDQDLCVLMAPADDWEDGQDRGRTHRRSGPRRLDRSRSQVAHRPRPGRPSHAGAPPRPPRGRPSGGRPCAGDADAPAPHQPSIRVRTD